MRVKGNAFRELTLVAGPNVSDGFLSSSSVFSLDLSSPSRCIPYLSFCRGFQLNPLRRVMDPDERTNERTGEEVCAVLRFVFSVPGIAN